jgi:ergothioneine biosynthesis protein EgtB
MVGVSPRGVAPAPIAPTAKESIAVDYRRVRDASRALSANISAEDHVVQSMPDASPMKWHLAHVTWFFETFLLRDYATRYAVFDEAFHFLFNSYYEAEGPRHARPRRGLLTRPSLEQVLAYRQHVDEGMAALIERCDDETWAAIAPLIELGLAHEEQHQELMLTDILHLFTCNPLHPAFRPFRPHATIEAPPLDWHEVAGGTYEIGHTGSAFAFDCEGPRHAVLLRDYRIASRPVTNAEWRAFIDEGGYRRSEFWLSDGWAAVQTEAWEAPLYWERDGDDWASMTLSGLRPIEPDAPVCQVSPYEADAFARWAGKRLPTEAEWEVAAQDAPVRGNWAGSGLLRPVAADPRDGPLLQLFGDVWEITQSAFSPYPGFRPTTGAVGEYNGKFMSSQIVLRGGSCATPDGHTRATYRNFFYPHMRWQFSGLRLAEDA